MILITQTPYENLHRHMDKIYTPAWPVLVYQADIPRLNDAQRVEREEPYNPITSARWHTTLTLVRYN